MLENISSQRNNIAPSRLGNSMSFSIEKAHFRSKSHRHKNQNPKVYFFFHENSSEFLNIFFSKNLSKVAIFTNDKKLKIFFQHFFLIMRFLVVLSVIKVLNSDTSGKLVEKYLWHRSKFTSWLRRL